MADIGKVIKELEALDKAMHDNQCYVCSHEFIEVTEKFGTCIIADALELLKDQPQIVRCKDCKHFEYKEWWADIGHGAKILATDHCPTCNKWGRGCKTEPEGYCFLAERKDSE